MDGVVIGKQILGPDGWNIHGEDDDPFRLNSSDVLIEDSVEVAEKWCAANPGFRVADEADGDIGEPNFVDRLGLPPGARP